MTAEQYDLIARELDGFEIGARSRSAALLAWFLQNVWRLEPEDVEDCICDGHGDKGIDGLFVDENLSELTLFQVKHRKAAHITQGDGDLKGLVGAANWFESPDTVQALLDAGPNQELRHLVHRFNLKKRVAEGLRTTRLVFVTNGLLDVSGDDYARAMLEAAPNLEVWDRDRLGPIAERTRRPDFLEGVFELPAEGGPILIDLTDAETMGVAVVPAEKLVELPGIQDRSLFSRNVRLALGRTRINRELQSTARAHDEHALFPAYHNGLTLLTNSMTPSDDGQALVLDGITVVNGCQSLVALHDNAEHLTPALKVLVKVVQTAPDSNVASQITYRTNNQNAVNMRDQRSTDPIMLDLQGQTREAFGGTFGLRIRAGEVVDAEWVLDNQDAAQLITAVYLQEPWAAVRKVRLFDEDFRRVFSRSIDAHKLYLLAQLEGVVNEKREALRPELQSAFASVRYALLYLVAEVARLTELGQLLFERPQAWLPARDQEVIVALETLADEVVESVNYHIESKTEPAEDDYNPDFDPKVAFKSRSGVGELAHDVTRFARRHAKHDEGLLFSVEPA